MLPLGFYRVNGESMLPGYAPGDLLVGVRWFRPRVGQVVIARREKPLIKRIVRMDAKGVWLEGDNPGRSTDSRHYGPLPPAALEAKIIRKLG
jgi:phage repressor protein C with HTH and peptisase S24 domain